MMSNRPLPVSDLQEFAPVLPDVQVFRLVHTKSKPTTQQKQAFVQSNGSEIKTQGGPKEALSRPVALQNIALKLQRCSIKNVQRTGTFGDNQQLRTMFAFRKC